VRLGKLDVDKEQKLANDMRIQSIPAVFAFHQGRVVSSFVGVPDDAKYAAHTYIHTYTSAHICNHTKVICTIA